MTRLFATVAVGAALLASADAQPGVRRATNIAAILAYPTFYHMRPILLVGTVAQQQTGEIRVSGDTGSLRVVPAGNAPDGRNEVRGQFWDVGRIKSDDPRLAVYDLRAAFGIDPDAGWPRPGDVMAIVSATVTAAPPTPAAVESEKTPGFPQASIRSIVLDPSRYLDRPVTTAGQYYGRNLAGDLPDSPRQSRYDFVLRSADASIWVTNLRPRGRDEKGRNFELGLDARIDTGKWLQISGTVRQGRGLLWIDGAPGSLALAQPPTETFEQEVPVVIPAAPPAEVVFSAPTDDEIEVATDTNVRIQFSRDIDPDTLKGRIRVSYIDPADAAAVTPISSGDFTSQYRAFNRVLEVTFSRPLERFRTVRLELVEGILGTDGQPLKPWSLTFLLGGS